MHYPSAISCCQHNATHTETDYADIPAVLKQAIAIPARYSYDSNMNSGDVVAIIGALFAGITGLWVAYLRYELLEHGIQPPPAGLEPPKKPLPEKGKSDDVA